MVGGAQNWAPDPGLVTSKPPSMAEGHLRQAASPAAYKRCIVPHARRGHFHLCPDTPSGRNYVRYEIGSCSRYAGHDNSRLHGIHNLGCGVNFEATKSVCRRPVHAHVGVDSLGSTACFSHPSCGPVVAWFPRLQLHHPEHHCQHHCHWQGHCLAVRLPGETSWAHARLWDDCARLSMRLARPPAAARPRRTHPAAAATGPVALRANRLVHATADS